MAIAIRRDRCDRQVMSPAEPYCMQAQRARLGAGFELRALSSALAMVTFATGTAALAQERELAPEEQAGLQYLSLIHI